MHTLQDQWAHEQEIQRWKLEDRIYKAELALSAWPGFDFDAWQRSLPRTTLTELAFFFEAKLAELRAAMDAECTCTPRDAQACPVCRAALSDSEIPY